MYRRDVDDKKRSWTNVVTKINTVCDDVEFQIIQNPKIPLAQHNKSFGPSLIMRTVIICPGNGCNNIRQSNWYGYLYEALKQRDIPCICENFPDPLHARRDRWVPFMRSLATKSGDKNNNDKKDDANNSNNNIILVGHSSGAQAALRYAEMYPVYACVLVSATYSDLGDAHERASGYYPEHKQDGEVNNPYLFDTMKENCSTWYQFHSDDDPFIPLREAEQIRDGLGLSTDTNTYHMLPGRSHFFEFSPELLDIVLSLV